jgi:protein-disulfide reductase (glutathione)
MEDPMRTSGRTSSRRILATTVAVAALLLTAGRTAVAGGDWNDANVAWQSYEAGLAAAKKDKKPVLLIFFTEWCPHCTNYSKLFHDQKVIDQTKKFVVIRLDKDKNADLSKKYAPDGEYIPRTYFLGSDGTLDPAITAPRSEYKYFYDEANPAQLLASMDAALKKLH